MTDRQSNSSRGRREFPSMPPSSAGAPKRYLQSTPYTKVVLALMSGRSADDVLDSRRSAHLAVMRELTKYKKDGDLPDQLVGDHALFHLEAGRRWLELTAARLDALAEVVRS